MRLARYLPPLAIAVAAILWSLDGLIRQNLSHVPSIAIVFFEHLLAAVLFVPFLFRGWTEIKAAGRASWASVGWVALFGGLVGTFCYTKALSFVGFIDLSVVVLLQKLQPVFAIVLAAILLKEPITRRFLGLAFVAIVGGYLLTFKDGVPNLEVEGDQLTAALLAVGAAFAWGSSTVMGKYALRTMSFFSLTALRMFVTSLLSLPLFLLVAFEPAALQLAGGDWIFIVVIVLSTGGVAVSVYYYGLQRVLASHATLYEMFWPLSAVFIDWAVYGTVLSPLQIIGGMMLIAVSVALGKGGKEKVGRRKWKVGSGK